MRRSSKSTAIICAFTFSVGLAAPALASHYPSPESTPNTAAAVAFSANPQLPQDPNANGRATVVFADTALSGWRTDYGMKNVSLYLPNTLNWSRVGGVNSGASGTCQTTGGNVAKPAYGLCVNVQSRDNIMDGPAPSTADYRATVGLTCGPNCGPFFDGTYTGSSEWRSQFNNEQGGGTLKNENVVAHELTHILGLDHHASQEYANNRWYPGVQGEFGNELVGYFNEQCYLCGEKYTEAVDKHVPNLYEKTRMAAQWGYSSAF